MTQSRKRPRRSPAKLMRGMQPKRKPKNYPRLIKDASTGLVITRGAKGTRVVTSEEVNAIANEDVTPHPATKPLLRSRKSASRLSSAMKGTTTPVTEYVKALKAASGGAWSATEFVKLANLSPLTLKEWRDSFSIVYWTDDNGRCFYPKWQFDGRFKVLPAVRTILGLLRTHDTNHVLTRFLRPVIGNKEESALDLIQSGRSAAAVAFIENWYPS